MKITNADLAMEDWKEFLDKQGITSTNKYYFTYPHARCAVAFAAGWNYANQRNAKIIEELTRELAQARQLFVDARSE